MKLINKIKNIMLLIAVVLMMFPGSIIDAANDDPPSTIITGDSSKILEYIGPGTHLSRFGFKKLQDGSIYYCMTHRLKTPDSDLYYDRDNSVDITNEYPGIIYILQNGYPNKKSGEFLTGNKYYDYYITQGAIHWYIDRKNGISDTVRFNSDKKPQLGSEFKISAQDPKGLRPYIKAFVEAAIEATDGVNYNATPKITLTNSTRFMTLDESDNNWKSNKFTVEGINNVKNNYKVEFDGQIPDGTVICDEDGNNCSANSKNIDALNKKFIIKTPSSSVSGETNDISIKVKVSTEGTIINAYQYKPGKNQKNSDGSTPQDIVVINYKTQAVNKSFTLKINSKEKRKVKFAKVDSDNTSTYVADAKLGYYEVDNDGNTIGDEIQITSTNSPVEKDLLPGNYCLREITPPSGYVKVTTPVCFSLDLNGDAVYFGTTTQIDKDGDVVIVKIANKKNNIKIKKVNSIDQTLTGASLSLYKIKSATSDEDDPTKEKIRDWNSGSEAEEFSGLAPGWYMIVENSAPEGYAITQPVRFRVKNDGNIVGTNNKAITSIDVKNYKTVTIHKTDITGTKEIPHAYLRVIDSDGVIRDEWESEEIPHEVNGLGVGFYTLEETVAPPGYALTSSIQFEIKEDGSVSEVSMVNEIISLTISKQDITNGKELKDAHLVIRKENGEVYTEWDSSDEEKVIEMIPAGTYTLEETISPDGYILNTEIITFVVDEYGKVTVDGKEVDKIIMYNTPETPVPKTAANISVFVYLIGIIATSGGAYLLYTKKKLNK